MHHPSGVRFRDQNTWTVGVKRKDIVLKAVSGNGLAAQPGAFAMQGFSWKAATFLQPQHCPGMGWAAPASVFVVAHGAPGPFSTLPQGWERVCRCSWCLLFTDSTLGHSLKLHLCLQRPQPSPKHIKNSGKSGRQRNSQEFFYFQG